MSCYCAPFVPQLISTIITQKGFQKQYHFVTQQNLVPILQTKWRGNILRKQDQGGGQFMYSTIFLILHNILLIFIDFIQRSYLKKLTKREYRQQLIEVLRSAYVHKKKVGERYTLILSRVQKSSHWCSVVVRRGDARSGVVLFT
ncbi:hypothetical protein TNCV_2786201 [Trichonephila clavipes]|nr:hypothetical protein TNCV_2786201 [Trichonephila clavipes]